MGTFSLTSPTIWGHDMDMSAYLNKATLSASAADLDVTTFASGGAVTRIGGLKTVAFNSEGFWDSVPDASIFASLGVADRVVTVSPRGAELEVAYMFQSGRFTYDQFGVVGEATPFSVSSMNSNGQGLIRGQVGSAKRTISSTGNVGQAVNLGLLGTGQFLYGSFHAFSVGTTLTVRIMSGTSAGSTPNVRITMPAITVVGGYWAVRLAGPVASDTWWVWNASTTTGSFSVAGAIGIGS